MEPVALQMLHNFKQYADQIETFRTLPTDAERFVYWHAPGMLWPTRAALGIPNGWVNAMTDYAEVNGVPLILCKLVDGKFKAHKDFVDSPVIRWTTPDGQAPDYYKPLSTIPPGRVVLLKFLVEASDSSAYLRGLGLTRDAAGTAYGLAD